jgi:hypothetical protein
MPRRNKKNEPENKQKFVTIYHIIETQICWWWTLNQKNTPCSICKYRIKNYNTHFISIPIFAMNIIIHGVKKLIISFDVGLLMAFKHSKRSMGRK